jgi:hypothetical protein
VHDFFLSGFIDLLAVFLFNHIVESVLSAALPQLASYADVVRLINQSFAQKYILFSIQRILKLLLLGLPCLHAEVAGLVVYSDAFAIYIVYRKVLVCGCELWQVQQHGLSLLLRGYGPCCQLALIFLGLEVFSNLNKGLALFTPEHLKQVCKFAVVEMGLDFNFLV